MNTTELRRLLDAATPGPWHARATDDWKCQTAFYVSTIPGSGMQHDGQRGLDIDADIDSDNIIAVTLLQSPPVATAEASDANTELIAAAVNALPALLAMVEAAEKQQYYLNLRIKRLGEAVTDLMKESADMPGNVYLPADRIRDVYHALTGHIKHVEEPTP